MQKRMVREVVGGEDAREPAEVIPAARKAGAVS
jgi:hypothetical protein